MRAILPLFPLGLVLFPEGRLPLRVFEARYMDMVRTAMRESSTFGVCLIRKGDEVGRKGVETHDVGCRARIDTWNMEQLGVLQIETTGTERFRILSNYVQADGLMVADVETLPDEPAVAVPDDALLCAGLLERILTQLKDAAAENQARGTLYPQVTEPFRLEDATWVGNRLGDLLPLPLPAKQELMAMTDPIERLAIVKRYLVEQGIV